MTSQQKVLHTPTSVKVNPLGKAVPLLLMAQRNRNVYEYASDVGGLPRIQDGIENARKGKLFQKVRQDMLEGKRPKWLCKVLERRR